MSILVPGARPGEWETLGDHERRIRALEAVDPCDCDGDEFCNYSAGVRSSSNLVGYWELGETSGQMLDTSGFSVTNPAHLNYVSNGTAASRGVAGPLPPDVDTGAFEQNFEGQGLLTAADYLTIPGAWGAGADSDRFIMPGTSPFAAAAFLKPKASASTFVGQIAGWMSVQVGTPSRESGWALRIVYPGLTLQFIRCRFVTGTYTETVLTSAALDPGVDYHVFCSYDGATMELAVDGEVVDTDTSAISLISPGADYVVTCGVAKPPAPASDYLARVFGTQSHTSIWDAAVPIETVQEFLTNCGDIVGDTMVVYLDGE